jgi:hypothetical protein
MKELHLSAFDMILGKNLTTTRAIIPKQGIHDRFLKE